MKYLQIVNASLVIFGGSMALIMAVVCVLYGAHVGDEPQLRGDLPRLFLLTGLFTAFGAAGATAFAAHRRGWTARWLLQGLPFAPAVGIALFLMTLGR